jgi:membrane protein YdbS with pleckstrin-like domain
MKYENPIIPYDDIPQFASIQLAPVEKAYKKVLYINWTIFYSIFIITAICLFVFIKSFQLIWLIALVFILLALAVGLTIASIEIGYKNKAWALREKDIIFKKGWIFHATHIIPFVKVQHCVVNSGPIGRKYGLASIKLNTASSNNIDISIHGLKQETADQLKAFIMSKIEADEPAQI